MMTTALGQEKRVGVLCVEDNPRVASALRTKLSQLAEFEWLGWLPTADTLADRADNDNPSIILLDLDMPGRNPLEALAELSTRAPGVRVIIFSGHVRKDLIASAIDSGAWGYVSKNDGEEALLSALRSVVAGELAMSPEVQTTWRR